MDEFDFKPNSHKSKEDKKTVQKIVNGTVKKKKKSTLQKITDAFVSDDAGDIKSFVIRDVLIPAAKKAISDIFENVSDGIKNGIYMVLYGEDGRGRKKSNSSSVSYHSYYERDRDERRNGSFQKTESYSYDSIIIDNRGEAEEVLVRMDELIDLYGSASVADFYELVGVTGKYTDNKYGWTDIHSAYVMRVRNENGFGYMIKLPKARPLN